MPADATKSDPRGPSARTGDQISATDDPERAAPPTPPADPTGGAADEYDHPDPLYTARTALWAMLGPATNDD